MIYVDRAMAFTWKIKRTKKTHSEKKQQQKTQCDFEVNESSLLNDGQIKGNLHNIKRIRKLSWLLLVLFMLKIKRSDESV